MFLYVGIEVAVATWLFTYLNMTCRLSKDLAGWSMTALWAGLTTGRMVSVHLFRYYPSDRIALSAMGLVLSGILCLALLPHLGTASLVVVYLLGLGLGPIFPTLVSSASERYGEHSASITSLVVTAGAFAGITFPLIIGQVFSRAGHQQGMLVLALFASILSTVFFVVQFRMALPAARIDDSIQVSGGSEPDSEAGSDSLDSLDTLPELLLSPETERAL